MIQSVDHWTQRASAFHRRHAVAVNGSIVAALIGFSALAFGVAPLAADAADLPQRVVIEDIQPEGIAEQLDALASLIVPT